MLQEIVMDGEQLRFARMPEDCHIVNFDYGVILQDPNLDQEQNEVYMIYTDLISEIVRIRGKFGQIFGMIELGFLQTKHKNTFQHEYKDIVSLIADKIDQLYTEYSNGNCISTVEFTEKLYNLKDTI